MTLVSEQQSDLIGQHFLGLHSFFDEQQACELKYVNINPDTTMSKAIILFTFKCLMFGKQLSLYTRSAI